jgi:uncharacterized repeat protein (TIGR02543 family)
MGIVRGKSYSKGTSFKCQSKENGNAQANGKGGSAKKWEVGTTLYYHSQKDDTYPVAICGTSGAPWVDGWYKTTIFPWATYTITYDAKEGTCSTTSATKTCNTALTLPTPSRGDATANGHKVTYNQNGWPNAITASQATNTIKYNFANWNTKSDGSGSAYTTSFNDSVAALGVAAPGNTTLYAQYSGTTTKGSVTLANPSASGYVFKSWNTKADGSGTPYSANQTITPSSDMTLYAIWDYDQATAYVKSSGAWTKGKVYYKENGAWVKAKKIYTKVNGAWVEGKA